MLGTAVEGRSHEEVAGALGLTSGSVRGLIYRARATLRAAAAALIPAPLVDWALRQQHGPHAGSSGVYQALAGGGSAGVAGAVLKGGAIVTVAGALAGTAAVITSHPLHTHHKTHVAFRARPHRQVIADLGGSTSTAPGGTDRVAAAELVATGAAEPRASRGAVTNGSSVVAQRSHGADVTQASSGERAGTGSTDAGSRQPKRDDSRGTDGSRRRDQNGAGTQSPTRSGGTGGADEPSGPRGVAAATNEGAWGAVSTATSTGSSGTCTTGTGPGCPTNSATAPTPGGIAGTGTSTTGE
jgi:hypothetical protein